MQHKSMVKWAYKEMAAPPGKFIVLQAFIALKEILSEYAPPRGREILDPPLYPVIK